MITSRFYNMNGTKIEACFFHKGDYFPDSEIAVPKQGIWARPVSLDWEHAFFLAESWRFVELDPDVRYLPQRIR